METLLMTTWKKPTEVKLLSGGNPQIPPARRRELIDQLRSQLDPLSAASGFGIDDVIDPRDTRRLLIDTFDRCPPRRQVKAMPPKFRPISPI